MRASARLLPAGDPDEGACERVGQGDGADRGAAEHRGGRAIQRRPGICRRAESLALWRPRRSDPALRQAPARRRLRQWHQIAQLAFCNIQKARQPRT